MILDNNIKLLSTFSPRQFLSGKKLEIPNETKCHCLFLWENFIETVDHLGCCDDEAILPPKKSWYQPWELQTGEKSGQPASLKLIL